MSYKEFLVWLKQGDWLARKLASKLKAVTGLAREQRVKHAFDLQLTLTLRGFWRLDSG